jgi:hypothetical protein
MATLLHPFFDVAKLLIDKGANVGAQNTVRCTDSRSVMTHCDHACVHGAQFGETPLHVALSSEDENYSGLEVRRLVEAGTKLNVFRTPGCTLNPR